MRRSTEVRIHIVAGSTIDACARGRLPNRLYCSRHLLRGHFNYVTVPFLKRSKSQKIWLETKSDDGFSTLMTIVIVEPKSLNIHCKKARTIHQRLPRVRDIHIENATIFYRSF